MPEPMPTASLAFPIHDAGELSAGARRAGFTGFADFAVHVRELPYARPSRPHDTLAVLREGRGTCSGKHGLLAGVAHECGHHRIELAVGLYAMDAANTPGVGEVLAAAGVSSIPEAHCYLRVDGDRWDFTGLPATITSPFAALMEEHLVSPTTLPVTKRRIHRRAVAAWARRTGIEFAAAWALRESCIRAIAVRHHP